MLAAYRRALAGVRALEAAAPGILHGFDIVGEEDGGNTNGFYAPVLTTPPRVPLQLHAGESLSAADTNVEDALDLGALRIGHGLNMDLFPGLEDRVRAAAGELR